MSDSSSDSSDDDENWAAFQSVAVSYEQVVTQHESFAEKARRRSENKGISSRGHGSGSINLVSNNYENEKEDNGPDFIQRKIAAMLEAKISETFEDLPAESNADGIECPMLNREVKSAKNKRKEQKSEVSIKTCSASHDKTSQAHLRSSSVSAPSASTSGPYFDDNEECTGLRLFRRVPRGAPLVIRQDEKQCIAHAARVIRTTAKERILRGTRYAADESDTARCVSVLGAQGDTTTESAKAEMEARKRAKKAASVAESLRRKNEVAASEPSSVIDDGADAAAGKKKKKKKRKIEATVVETDKSFIPYEQRMKVLLGTP
ncbi:hypothetical protein CEUSTIGMA_g4953.t1 [Chlamydomonas eustigma]|uniref:Uncharacterized protein n=1 Tax=Chlamydomonas eustigma TaxID=1157962 RepID=A0A250X3L3_9CHLO|nr:hypothetical protein CEUSTIGMA_g4953.t1 [Chlamydomonas eustigma]|eukprot:GAX77509.1 hypothetical protein CEUSTIGMA_g4953.t1 [Chlamydomonas eustigma]